VRQEHRSLWFCSPPGLMLAGPGQEDESLHARSVHRAEVIDPPGTHPGSTEGAKCGWPVVHRIDPWHEICTGNFQADR
jgi:hypothetical protein